MQTIWRIGFLCSDGKSEWCGVGNIEIAAIAFPDARVSAEKLTWDWKAKRPLISKVILTWPSGKTYWTGTLSNDQISWEMKPLPVYAGFELDLGFRGKKPIEATEQVVEAA